jgi:hypothetical protein
LIEPHTNVLLSRFDLESLVSAPGACGLAAGCMQNESEVKTDINLRNEEVRSKSPGSFGNIQVEENTHVVFVVFPPLSGPLTRGGSYFRPRPTPLKIFEGVS